MKQRLGVAMALLPDPELLILDEPANGLDPLGIIEMREMLRRLAGQGKTILLSSHLLGELEQLADWLIMLNQGKVLFCGAARELLAQRVDVVVESQDALQLDVATRIAGDAGFAVTREDQVLRIACPAGFAETLNRMAKEAGAPDLTIRVREARVRAGRDPCRAASADCRIMGGVAWPGRDRAWGPRRRGVHCDRGCGVAQAPVNSDIAQPDPCVIEARRAFSGRRADGSAADAGMSWD